MRGVRKVINGQGCLGVDENGSYIYRPIGDHQALFHFCRCGIYGYFVSYYGSSSSGGGWPNFVNCVPACRYFNLVFAQMRTTKVFSGFLCPREKRRKSLEMINVYLVQRCTTV